MKIIPNADDTELEILDDNGKLVYIIQATEPMTILEK